MRGNPSLTTHHSSLRQAADPRISALLAEAERRWGRGALVRLGDIIERAEVEVIPTGFPTLDEALGIGGLPRGRISEIFGPDSSGKQALVANLIAQCQHAEGVAAYIDPGSHLDPEQMRAQGVDSRSLLVAQPKECLQALEMAIQLVRSGGIQLMIFDSGLSIRHSALGLALRRLVSAVDRNQVAFVFLSNQQDRWEHPRPSGPGLALGSQRYRGEQALRFFASVRLKLERKEWIRRGREVIGCRSVVQVAKNRLAPPLKKTAVELLFYRFPPQAPVLQICHPGPKVSGADCPREALSTCV